MRCPKCNSDNPVNHRFCSACGASLTLTCSNCDFENPPTSKFCGECGKSLDQSDNQVTDRVPSTAEISQSEAEHRHLTVMFCDLVGSTQLSRHMDPEELRRLNLSYQETCARIIKQFDGFVARYMGDGVLAYFGYPKAHEDDAQRAILAGLALVEAMAPLEEKFKQYLDTRLAIRVGIATGNVIVGDLIGEGASQEAAVVGEAPNLAARLQSLAEHNTIYLSKKTQRLTQGQFMFEKLGMKEIRGFEEAQEVWQVLSESDTVSRFEATHKTGITPLIGREQEISLLSERLISARAGNGQVVLISGEPGIGKSRIIEALSLDDLSQGFTKIHIQCSPHHLNSTLHPISEWLIHIAGFERGDTNNQKLKKLEEYLKLNLELSHHGMIDEQLFLLGNFLTIKLPEQRPSLELGDRELKRRTLGLLTNLLLGMGHSEPTIIIVEDVHWIDQTTLELLDGVIDKSPETASLVLVTFRPEFKASWTGQAHVTLLSLNRMSQKNCTKLIENIVDKIEMPEEILAQIVAKTDGIPLFVEELTKTVLESGVVEERQENHLLNQPLPSLAIPDTLQDSLMARLDRLAPVKEILHIGAVIGREFSYDLLSAVAKQSEKNLRESLNKLLESGLVFQRGIAPDATYIFKHALVRDTAYESILSSARQLLHGRVARVLERDFRAIVLSDPAILAYHFEETGSLFEALDYWQKAAEQALTRMGTHEAVEHYRKAIALIPSLGQDDSFVEKELSIHVSYANTLRILDRYEEAHESLQRAEELALTHKKNAELARIHHCRGNVYFPQGEIESCMKQHQLALSCALESKLPDREAQALSGLGDAYYLRCQMPTAHDYFVKSVEICQRHGFERIEAANRLMVAWTAMWAKDLFTAVRLGKEAATFAENVDHKRAEMIARQLLSVAFVDMEQIDDARCEVERVYQISEQLGAGRFTAFSFYHKVKMALAQGDKALAEKEVDEGLKFSRQSSHTFSGPCLLGLKGYLASSSEERLNHWNEAKTMLSKGCPGHNHLFFNRDLIDVCLLERDWDSCENYCSLLELYTSKEPMPWTDLVISRGRCLSRIGRGANKNNASQELVDLEAECHRLGMITLVPMLHQAGN